ncbi:MAG: LysR family transcriptional regulator [Firmicutes bacterium]|nr:LysR family transcriptional regulator [Bacillota bacterium]
MTFEDLELFWALAERQSITDAARTVSVSQPTASRRLKAMEEELGAELVDRDTYPLSLTPFGFLFLNFADEVLQKYRALRLTAGTNHSIIGTLTVATSSSPAARLVTRWMADFVTAHPGIHLRLAEMNSAEVERQIDDGYVELGFMGSLPSTPDLVSLPIADDEIVLLVPHHPPFGNWPRPVPWDLVHSAPFIIRTPGSATQKTVDHSIRERGWPPLSHVVLEVDTGAAVIDAVESGLGAGFVSRELLFRRELTKSSPWPVKSLNIARPFYLVHHRARIESQPTAREFLRYARLRLNPQSGQESNQQEVPRT